MSEAPKLYRELASWWPLMSAPEDYAEAAALYERELCSAASRPMRKVLELGSGGGNNASHLKQRYEMTLVDRSPGMLDVSRANGPSGAGLRSRVRPRRRRLHDHRG